MGQGIAWAWAHTIQQYKRAFGAPPPDWLGQLTLTQRLRLARTAVKLNWKLPNQVLPDAPDKTQNRRGET